MNSTPPGNQPAARAACAAWIASAVLPTPASPATADTTTAPAPAAGSSSPATCASSASRPVNPAASGGKLRQRHRRRRRLAGDERGVGEIAALQHRAAEAPAADRAGSLPAVLAGHQPASGSPGRDGAGGAAPNVKPVKSRPCSTGPLNVPPLIVFVTFPVFSRAGGSCSRPASLLSRCRRPEEPTTRRLPAAPPAPPPRSPARCPHPPRSVPGRPTKSAQTPPPTLPKLRPIGQPAS